MRNSSRKSGKHVHLKDKSNPSSKQRNEVPIGPMLCGDIDMRIDRNGTWFYGGSPIGRHQLVKLFSSVLKRDDSGDFWLITPAEKARIKVEDAPFIGVELLKENTGNNQKLKIRTNIDEIFPLSAKHPLKVEFNPKTKEPSPYITLRKGIEARLSRPVYYELVELGEESLYRKELMYGVWSYKTFFPLGKL